MTHLKRKKQNKCPYCGADTKIVHSSEIYNGKDFGFSLICSNYPKCDAYSSCHNKTKVPKGSVANKKLRELRSLAHLKFDKIWKSKILTRNDAYYFLSKLINKNLEECHIGQSTEKECIKLLKKLEERNWKEELKKN